MNNKTSKLVLTVAREDKGLIIKAVRLEGLNLETWATRVLLDAATLTIAQQGGGKDAP
jgi:hypothetical protein